MKLYKKIVSYDKLTAQEWINIRKIIHALRSRLKRSKNFVFTQLRFPCVLDRDCIDLVSEVSLTESAQAKMEGMLSAAEDRVIFVIDLPAGDKTAHIYAYKIPEYLIPER